MNFYEAVNEVDINSVSRAITVCEGTFAGEKMIISNGEPVWMSDGNGFIATHADELLQIEDNGLFEVNGFSVYAELLCSEKHIVICGAGHVATACVKLAKMMGCRVTVIDDRAEFVDNAISCGADEGLCMDYIEALKTIPGSIDTYFIVAARSHSFDKDCLLNIVKKPNAYIGMLGSRRKFAMIMEALRQDGIPEDVIDSIYTPIGLDIGAETPVEVGFAIMSQIVEVKNRKKRNFGFPSDIMKEVLSGDRGPLVLATIVAKRGSTARGIGTKMIVKPDGSITGTVGGGASEAAVIQKSVKLLEEMNGEGKSASPFIMNVGTDGKSAANGTTCGGSLGILMEIV